MIPTIRERNTYLNRDFKISTKVHVHEKSLIFSMDKVHQKVQFTGISSTKVHEILNVHKTLIYSNFLIIFDYGWS